MSYLRRVCAVCKEDKKRDEYRINQWRNRGNQARCLDCQNTHGKKVKKAKGLFKKGEVVQCTECEAWMKAPSEEQVAGLRCASCRHLIWAPGAGSEPPAPRAEKRQRSKPCFSKGEVVACPDCDSWMKAPEDEEVEGLKCAGCRNIIWPKGGKHSVAKKYKSKPSAPDEPEPTMYVEKRRFTTYGWEETCAGCRGGGRKHTCSKIMNPNA